MSSTIGGFVTPSTDSCLSGPVFWGSLIMTMTLWITNQTIPWVTALAKSTGALSGDGLAAAMDQGGEARSRTFLWSCFSVIILQDCWS